MPRTVPAASHMRGEDRIDEHIHLHGAPGDDRRPHEMENALHAGIVPVAHKAEAIASLEQRRELHAELRQSAEQRADAEADHRPLTERVRLVPVAESHLDALPRDTGQGANEVDVEPLRFAVVVEIVERTKNRGAAVDEGLPASDGILGRFGRAGLALLSGRPTGAHAAHRK